MRHVALLRGINVGKAKRIAMADLRALVESLGYRDVATLLNSGNVVLTAPNSVKGDHGSRIQKAIAAKLGVTARVTVLTAEELAVVVRDNPLVEPGTEFGSSVFRLRPLDGDRSRAGRKTEQPNSVPSASRLLVAVLADVADRPRLAALAKRDWGEKRFAVGARVAYVWMPDGVIESAAAKALEREFGDAVTSRNWSTVLKLAALAHADP